MKHARKYEQLKEAYGKDAVEALINELDSITANNQQTAEKAEPVKLVTLLLRLESTQQILDTSISNLCRKIETLRAAPNPQYENDPGDLVDCLTLKTPKAWKGQAFEIEKLTFTQHHIERALHHYERRIDNLEATPHVLARNEKSMAYFGKLLRSAKVVDIVDWMAVLEERLSPKEIDHVLALDLVIKGRPEKVNSRKEAFVAVAASENLSEGDLETICSRAQLLRKAGLLAIPMIAGEGVDRNLLRKARAQHAAVLTDGTQYFWEESQRYYLKNLKALV